MADRYCVIIPALNAARSIGDVVQQIKRQGLPVVVVDDGSRDQTAAIAAQQGALVISHLRNEGKGRALRTGFDYAIRSQYDGVVTLDSDGQHDPQEILRLIREGETQHAGMVIGNRMLTGVSMPRARHWTNVMMSRFISVLSRQRIPDSQCGFRVIRKEVLISVPLRARRYDLETELVLGAAHRRWKIISVPIRTIYPTHHVSHIQPVPDTFRFFFLVLRHLCHL